MLQIDIEPSERIATLTLDRPDKRNALSLELMERITCELGELSRQHELAVRGVVLVLEVEPDLTR